MHTNWNQSSVDFVKIQYILHKIHVDRYELTMLFIPIKIQTVDFKLSQIVAVIKRIKSLYKHLS